MERWNGKVAVVTGASSGIGEGIAILLVKHGMKVVGLARREERLNQVKNKLQDCIGKFYPVKCDLTVEDDILNAFKWVTDNLGGVNVLVNNAGTGRFETLVGLKSSDMKTIYGLNLIALQICCQEALKSMKAHNINDGHIINISSLIAHGNPPMVPRAITYYASKKAVNAISDGLRAELAAENSGIRVSVISPGLVDTEILDVVGMKLPPHVLATAIKPSEVAETVAFILQFPQHANISEIVITNTKLAEFQEAASEAPK